MPVILAEDVSVWLNQWAEMIRMQRFDDAKHLFADDVHGFGTVMTAVTGRDQLIQGQWQAVWPRTRAFSFNMDTVRAWGNDTLCALAVQWRSEGIEHASNNIFLRSGRATVVLQRVTEGWQAIHTHFSIDPTPEKFMPASSPRHPSAVSCTTKDDAGTGL